MKTTGVRHLRNHYAELLRRVERGEEIGITRRGRVVARLVPVEKSGAKTDWHASFARRLPRAGKPLTDAQRAAVLSESQGF